MRTKKRICAVLLAAAALFCMGGCEASSDAGGTIRIAVTGDGEMYGYDPSILNSIAMAVEDGNTLYAGQGINVEYEVYDDDTKYSQGVTMAESLVEDSRTTAILGTHSFLITDMVAELANAHEKVLVAYNGCNDGVLDKGYDYVFNNLFSAEQSGACMAEYVKSRADLNRIAVYSSHVSYEDDWVRAFDRGLAGSGKLIVDCTNTISFDQERRQAVERWQTLQADAVLIIQYYAADAYDMACYVSKSAPDMQLLGDSSFDYAEMLAAYGVQVEGIVIPDVLMYDDGNTIETYDQRYQDKFGQRPTRWGSHAYDTVMMLVETAASVDSTDPSKIALALHGENGYSGICGTARFDEHGRLQNNRQRLLVCRNGLFVALDQGGVADEKAHS